MFGLAVSLLQERINLLYDNGLPSFALFTSPATANETQVVESGHLVLDGGRGVAEFGWIVLVISRHYRHQCAIRDVAQGNHLMTRGETIMEKFEFQDLCNWKSCSWDFYIFKCE